MRILCTLSFIFLLSLTYAKAQGKFWLYFNDKECSQSLSYDDYLDQPIHQAYLDSLIKLNCVIHAKSKWLNAVSISADKEVLSQIEKLSFIKSSSPINNRIKIAATKAPEIENIVLGLKQMYADTLITIGLTGKGIKVGIIDGGFLEADDKNSLRNIIKNKNFTYKNFIEKHMKDPFFGSKRFDDDHGTTVWELIAGASNDNNLQSGMATDATFYLARTDQGDREYRGEEDYWIEAIEWMYENGVRLVNSSLGYSTGYDKPEENYTPQQVNGEFAAITRAAEIAANEKNMIIVMAAGNEGNNDFGTISIPADADGIISVGATGYSTWKKQRYSSTGPTSLNYVKPEIACYSDFGTSFAAPLVTGVIACVLQKHPQLTTQEMISAIKQASHLSPFPNNYLGYGVPNVKNLLNLLRNEEIHHLYEKIRCSEDEIQLKVTGDNVVLFHKQTDYIVLDQETAKPRRNQLKVKRKDGASFTTVAIPGKVIEIEWID